MPTNREREYYRMGYQDGLKDARRDIGSDFGKEDPYLAALGYERTRTGMRAVKPKKRKLSPWNKFVKANSKKPRFRYKSGAKRGKVNLKALGVAYRKKKRR